MNKTAFARGLLVGFALLLLFMIPGFAGGQDKALIEAARKEGKVTIFGSLQDEVMKEIQASFEKKYPGVKSVYWRASTTAVMDRAISEFRTGNVSWDVFFTGIDAMEIMRNEGMFLRYQTAASKNFDQSYHHEFYSPNYRSSIIGFVYNTRSMSIPNGTARPPCPIPLHILPWPNGFPACTWFWATKAKKTNIRTGWPRAARCSTARSRQR